MLQLRLSKLRASRHVKIRVGSEERFAEVHFYFQFLVNGHDAALGFVSCFGFPDPDCYKKSVGTYITMPHLRDVDVRVVDVKDIISVVMMAPDPNFVADSVAQPGISTTHWVLMEKPGLKVAQILSGYKEEYEDN
ncbi:hypothetical protein FISHEDRAFT_75854 [Fistulina hepatica ATCC 64428]|uniref:Uncharacterized protein n=1 Tax=Fistulina hepatica ATCC 64428 TaxID=1128425 RepID=A0A0D7A4R0_9AGAR|nr:hypothetical protein FISHEDRAFT_75854 [Fistulina hepatica ATCC 64428]